MAWLMTIFTGTVLVLLFKKWKKWKKWWSLAIVTALFACSLAATEIGGWLSSLLAGILSWLGSLGEAAVPGALIAAVLVLIAIPAIIYGFKDKKADWWEMTCLILLPLLFTIASGPVAANGGTLTDAIAGFGSQGLSYLVSG